MSSSQLTFTPSFFRGVGQQNQPVWPRVSPPPHSPRWWPGHIGPRATYTLPTWYFHAGFTAYMYYPKKYVPF